MLIVDEISFATQQDISKIESNCRLLKDSPLLYGGIDVVFCGDLRQLEPVEKTTQLYKEEFPAFQFHRVSKVRDRRRVRFKRIPHGR